MANVVTFRVEGDAAKAVQAILKVVEAQNKAGAAVKKTTDEVNKQEGAIVKAGNAVAGWAAGFLTVGTAVGLATSGIAAMNQRMKEGAAVIDRMAEGYKHFAQIARSPEEFKAMQAEAAALAVTQTMTPEAASAFVEERRRAGMTAAEADKIAAGDDLLKDPTRLLRAIGGMRGTFQETRGMDAERIADAITVASQRSGGRADIDAFAAAAETAQGAVELLGGTAAEMLAAEATATVRTRDVGLAATAVKSLAEKLEKRPDFKGLTLIESLDKLAAMSESRRGAVVGARGGEARQALDVLLTELPAFKASTQAIQEGMDKGGAFAAQIALAGTSPQLAAGEAAQGAKSAVEVARERTSGIAEKQYEAAFDAAEAVMRSRGAGEFAIGLERSTNWINRLIASPETAVRATGENIRANYGESAFSEYAEIMRTMTAALDANTAATQANNTTTSGNTEATKNNTGATPARSPRAFTPVNPADSDGR